MITLSSLIGLCIVAVAAVLWLVLTPSRLTPLVEKAANDYLNADVHVESVDVSFFSTFPRFTLKIDGGELVARADTSLQDMQRHPHRDSLLRFARCRVSFNPVALLKDDRIVVGRVLLDGASVYAWRDSSGRANWDFMPAGEDTAAVPDADTAGAFRPRSIVVRSLRIRNTDIVFNDRMTDVYARARDINARLRLGAGVRGAAAGVELSCGDLLFSQHGDLLLRRTALTLNTGVGLNADSMKVVLRNADLSVNDIQLSLDGTLKADTLRKAMDMDLRFSAVAPSVEKALRLIPESVVRHQKLTADGTVVLDKQPVVANQINTDPAYFAAIRQGMANVTSTENDGTAAAAYENAKYPTAAKTGTSQRTDLDVENNGWHVAYAPVEDPKLVVVVYVQNGYSGAKVTNAAKYISV